MFCVYKDQDKTNYDILDVTHWDLYILPTEFLDEHFPNQKTISLSTIQKSFDATDYTQIKSRIDFIFKH